ncbi:hypothetical protein C7A11_26645 [Pseudomonas simiae]|nr:hypothetical protein C7A11_26645 [Pseudomonas simiae]
MESIIELIIYLLACGVIAFILMEIASVKFKTESERFEKKNIAAKKKEKVETERFAVVENLIQEKEQKASEFEAKLKSTIEAPCRIECEKSLFSTISVVHSCIFIIGFHFLPVVGTFSLLAGLAYHFTVSKLTTKALFKRSKLIERLLSHQTDKLYKATLAAQQRTLSAVNEELRKLRIEKRDYKKNHKPA